MSERRSILLLCDESRSHAANVLQHIEALATLSSHDVYRFNPVDRPDACRKLDLEEFDVVALHYTIAVISARYLPPPLPERIAAFRGLKLQFIQDEYRAVDAATAGMRRLGIDVLFTCVPEPASARIYAARLPEATRVTMLPGYVPDELVGRKVPPIAERPIEVGYRGRDVPVWLGALGREKTEIGRGFVEHARRFDLLCDISSREQDRIYGEAWNRFLSSCRTTLGTESGASLVDFDGTVEARGRDYVARHPEATLAEIERDLTGPHEGNAVINTASPRLFEAAALRTAMILFRGEYAGVVEPWTHYVPLEKDFSNMDEVVAIVRDPARLEELAGRAYNDLVASGRYSLRAMVQEVDEIVDERSRALARPSKRAYRRAALRRRIPSLAGPSRLRVIAGRMLSPLAGTVLVARDRPLRRLALAGIADPQARRRGLGRDLWRLTALRRGVARGRFHVDAELASEEQLLFLSSRPGPALSKPGELRARASRDLESATVTKIVWNHSRLGVATGLAGGPLLAIPVGHHGVDGAHSFEAVAALAVTKPKLVLEALEPLLLEPASKPTQPVGVEA